MQIQPGNTYVGNYHVAKGSSARFVTDVDEKGVTYIPLKRNGNATPKTIDQTSFKIWANKKAKIS